MTTSVCRLAVRPAPNREFPFWPPGSEIFIHRSPSPPQDFSSNRALWTRSVVSV